MFKLSLLVQLSCLNHNNPIFPAYPSHFLWEMPTLARLKRHAGLWWELLYGIVQSLKKSGGFMILVTRTLILKLDHI